MEISEKMKIQGASLENELDYLKFKIKKPDLY